MVTNVMPRADHPPPIEQPTQSLNLDPIIPALFRTIREIDLARPLKAAANCLDSSALANVSLVSLKNAPYVLAQKTQRGRSVFPQWLDNGVSCRLRYLEAAVTSMASLVYNFVFATFFTAASLVTLGQIKIITNQCAKHWTHTAFAAGAIAVAVIGSFSPSMGVYANIAGLGATSVGMARWLQGDVISKLGAAYQQHKQGLKDAILEGLQGNRTFFDQNFVPFFTYLDAHFNAQTRTLADLSNTARGVVERWPRVNPGTTETTLNLLRNALSSLRHAFSSGSVPNVAPSVSPGSS
jgi:hypothetical protein